LLIISDKCQNKENVIDSLNIQNMLLEQDGYKIENKKEEKKDDFVDIHN